MYRYTPTWRDFHWQRDRRRGEPVALVTMIRRNESNAAVEAEAEMDDLVQLSKWRREWDSNPRRVAPHTLSKRADSAALASLPGEAMLVARSQHVSGDPAALERFR
jgi:hypothetical protein